MRWDISVSYRYGLYWVGALAVPSCPVKVLLLLISSLQAHTHYCISKLKADFLFFFFFSPLPNQSIRKMQGHCWLLQSHTLTHVSHWAVWLFAGFSTSPEDWDTCRHEGLFTDCFVLFAVMMSFLRAPLMVLCICACVWECSCPCAPCVCTHVRLRLHVFYAGWRFIPQWSRDITAIYWATRDWAHWDFYSVSWHKCANQLLMHYWANT